MLPAHRPCAGAASSSRAAAPSLPLLPPRRRARRVLQPAAALQPEHLEALSSSLGHLMTLAYEPVVLPCSALNCGDIVYRRWVLGRARDSTCWAPVSLDRPGPTACSRADFAAGASPAAPSPNCCALLQHARPSAAHGGARGEPAGDDRRGCMHTLRFACSAGAHCWAHPQCAPGACFALSLFLSLFTRCSI